MRTHSPSVSRYIGIWAHTHTVHNKPHVHTHKRPRAHTHTHTCGYTCTHAHARTDTTDLPVSVCSTRGDVESVAHFFTPHTHSGVTEFATRLLLLKLPLVRSTPTLLFPCSVGLMVVPGAGYKSSANSWTRIVCLLSGTPYCESKARSSGAAAIRANLLSSSLVLS
jgi:hypothetical protein